MSQALDGKYDDAIDNIMRSALSGRLIEHPMTVGMFRRLYVDIHAYALTKEQMYDEMLHQTEHAIEHLLSSSRINKPLVSPVEPEERATFLIRRPQYAEHMRHLREMLHAFLALFDDRIQTSLGLCNGHRPNTRAFLLESRGIPFAELEQPHLMLNQSKQVLNLKRLENCLFHLEEASIQLECLDRYQEDDVSLWARINNQRRQGIYVMRVFEIQRHMREAILLLWALHDAFYESNLGRDLIRTVTQTLTFLNDICEPYHSLLPEDSVNTTTYNVIFYVTNALIFLPEHLHEMGMTHCLPALTRGDAQRRAKHVTQDICRMISQSNDYVKLLFEAPAMISLFQQALKRIYRFANVTHQTVMDYLVFIQEQAFTSMLIQFDQWESRLGLKQGLLSAPMKTMLDAFYHGLLDSLHLRSIQYITLATTMTPFQVRLANVSARFDEANSVCQALMKKRDALTVFIDLSTQYHQARWPMMRRVTAFLRQRRVVSLTSCMDALGDIIPLFQEYMPSCKEACTMIVDETRWQRLLNTSVSSKTISDASLLIFQKIADVCKQYLNGLIQTQELILNLAREKKEYLGRQICIQIRENHGLVENYIKKMLTLERCLEPYTGRYRNLIYCDDEYNHVLLQYVKSIETDIIAKAQHAHHVDDAVKSLVTKHLQEFEKRYLCDFQKLEKIQVAIARMERYLNKQSLLLARQDHVFENQQTIQAKQALMLVLTNILKQRDVSVQQRLALLHQKMISPSFKKTLLSYHQHEKYHFSWLLACVLSFLEWIQCYKSERFLIYEQFKASINMPVSFEHTPCFFSPLSTFRKLPHIEAISSPTSSCQ
jgi:hypothetical protein